MLKKHYFSSNFNLNGCMLQTDVKKLAYLLPFWKNPPHFSFVNNTNLHRNGR
ncbi:Hypothetical protein Eab7_0934 [Exiguobacterium antarcticum B7]|nr:Hypothetical protein Eab7_0934 [Exiguobacterium antarcticum B7]